MFEGLDRQGVYTHSISSSPAGVFPGFTFGFWGLGYLHGLFFSKALEAFRDVSRNLADPNPWSRKTAFRLYSSDVGFEGGWVWGLGLYRAISGAMKGSSYQELSVCWGFKPRLRLCALMRLRPFSEGM